MNNNETYTYYDKDNTPLYRVNRYYKDNKKSFYSEKFEDSEWKKRTRRSGKSFVQTSSSPRRNKK